MCAPLYYPLALAASPLVVCQEQIYAMEWGMTSFEKTEVPRSAYLNNPATKNVVNPVDGEVVRLCVYVCEREREKRERVGVLQRSYFLTIHTTLLQYTQILLSYNSYRCRTPTSPHRSTLSAMVRVNPSSSHSPSPSWGW